MVARAGQALAEVAPVGGGQRAGRLVRAGGEDVRTGLDQGLAGREDPRVAGRRAWLDQGQDPEGGAPERGDGRRLFRLGDLGQGVAGDDEVGAGPVAGGGEVGAEAFCVFQRRGGVGGQGLGDVEEGAVGVEQAGAGDLRPGFQRRPAGPAGTGAGVEQAGGREAGGAAGQFLEHAAAGGVGGRQAGEDIGGGVGLAGDHRGRAAAGPIAGRDRPGPLRHVLARDALHQAVGGEAKLGRQVEGHGEGISRLLHELSSRKARSACPGPINTRWGRRWRGRAEACRRGANGCPSCFANRDDT